MYYAQSERAPRDPVARAALGRFLAMKGALRPGVVLIEEAQQFGLDAKTARALLAPLRKSLALRDAAAGLPRDSTLRIRASQDSSVLLQVALSTTGFGSSARRTSRDAEWHDVVDRPIGLDSVAAPRQPLGIDVFEALVPSVDVGRSILTLHANDRSALSAVGRRYQVLRTADGVRVAVGDGQVQPLGEALRTLSPAWWQLDLLHGVLVVR